MKTPKLARFYNLSSFSCSKCTFNLVQILRTSFSLVFCCAMLSLSSVAQKRQWAWSDTTQVDPLPDTSLITSDASLVDNSPCRESYNLGIEAASSVGYTGIGVGACCGGMSYGSCIPSILSLWTVSKEIPPDDYPPNVNVECYRWGYERQTAKKKTSAVNVGSIVGTVITAAVIIALAASDGGFVVCLGCGP